MSNNDFQLAGSLHLTLSGHLDQAVEAVSSGAEKHIVISADWIERAARRVYDALTDRGVHAQLWTDLDVAHYGPERLDDWMRSAYPRPVVLVIDGDHFPSYMTDTVLAAPNARLVVVTRESLVWAPLVTRGSGALKVAPWMPWSR